MHDGAAQVDAIREKALDANLDMFGDNVGNGADFATAPDAHASQSQPNRPEERAAQPVVRRLHELRFQPDAHVNRTPAADDARRHAAQCAHGRRFQQQCERRGQHGIEHDRQQQPRTQ